MIHIKKIPERPSQEEIDAIAKFSSATLHEAQGRRGALSSSIKPVDYRMKLCGPAFTVKSAPRDNIMLQLAINYAQPGDIIVVSGGEYEEAGSFGDVLTNACLAKGIGGLVTDKGVRDTLQLRDLGFPVFSLSVCIKGTVKETLTAVNDPIVIAVSRFTRATLSSVMPTVWWWSANRRRWMLPHLPKPGKTLKLAILPLIRRGSRSLKSVILSPC